MDKNIKNTNVINKSFFNNKFKYIVSLFITLVGILSLVGGTSYAILKGNTSSSKEQVIKTGSIKLKLTEKFENMNKKIMTMSDSDGLLQSDVYEFNIRNIGGNPAKYDLKLVNEVPSDYTGNVLDTKYVKVGLEINGEEYGPYSLGDVKNIIDSDIIYENEMVSYTLRVWLDETKEEELVSMEDYKSFLKLKVEAEQRVDSMDGGINTKVFNYTGDSQMYYVPRDGYYYIEMAGAQGGTVPTGYTGGLGAKTSGYVYLKAGEKLYFYVGGEGTSGTAATIATYEGGYNGGGNGYVSRANYSQTAASGGGATDVRLVGGNWNDKASLISRIMVAGGGGGAYSEYVSTSDTAYIWGGDGGTLYGEIPIYKSYAGYSSLNPKGGTQTNGGQGLNNWTATSYTDSYSGKFGSGGTGGNSYSGGGGGYYGGSSGVWQPGAGGSSYISGYAGVNSVGKSTIISHTDQTLHYSGKYFIGGQMISGVNEGNGYAKISYVETKPKKRNTKLNNVRYIKDCSNGSTVATKNSWQEIQAIKDGINIALGKTVTSTGTIYTTDTGKWSLQAVTDGSISNYNSDAYLNEDGLQCVTVDLGNTYDLDELGVWNNFNSTRSIYDNVTYVSSNNSTWIEVIDDATIQTSNGKRINAYTDVNNGYISDGLVLWYDGYANTGTTRNHTTTTWKDLSGSNNNGTLTGGTWYKDYLYFDGTDDYVNTNYKPSYDKYTLEAIVYPELTSSSDQEIFNSHNGGGIGLIYNDNYFKFSGYVGGYTELKTINKYSTNNKYHLVTTYDGNNVKLYVNGKLENEDTDHGVITSGNVPIFIGANPNSSGTGADAGYFLKGRIFNALIYNKVLTSDEILHNYIQDKQKFNLE